jgi:hypothetical protein
MSDISKPHEVVRRLQEAIWYPPHPPRTETELYRQSRRQLIEVEKQTCYICGSGDKLESHHRFLEWALSDSCDFAKMKAAHPDFDSWDKVVPGDESTYFHFIDSTYNLLILCEQHHRGPYGVHMITEPAWFAQRVITEEYLEKESDQ